MINAKVFIDNSIQNNDDILEKFLKEFTFSIHSFGHQHHVKVLSCKDRIIGDFEFIYIIGGMSRITIDDKKYICSQGDFVIIPPFIKHSIEMQLGDEFDNYWIHCDINPIYRHQDFILSILDKGEYRISLGMIQELQLLYQTIENEASLKGPGYKLVLESCLVQIIIFLMRHSGKKNESNIISSRSYTISKEIVNKSYNYINEKISESLVAEDVSCYLHISQSQLYKSFIKVLGISPSKFIQTIKIMRAEQLIRTTAYTISQISYMLGFSSPFHLSRIFKKYYGVSPRQYVDNLQ